MTATRKVENVADLRPGDLVSYQTAGMKVPEWGVVSGPARVPGYVFVRFAGDERGKLTPIAFLRRGHESAWMRNIGPVKPDGIDRWETFR